MGPESRAEEALEKLAAKDVEQIPVVEGELLSGRWQRIMFAELDQARQRRVVFHAQGA